MYYMSFSTWTTLCRYSIVRGKWACPRQNLVERLSEGDSTFAGSCSCKSVLCPLSVNSHVSVTTHCVLLDSSNALDILAQYDIIVDATDNVATRFPTCECGEVWGQRCSSRYLLNDACVLLGRPLVSGSALRFEGQLTVYGWRGGPCYRCLFPSPPPPHTVTNCSEGGVLGVGEECAHHRP